MIARTKTPIDININSRETRSAILSGRIIQTAERDNDETRIYSGEYFIKEEDGTETWVENFKFTLKGQEITDMGEATKTKVTAGMDIRERKRRRKYNHLCSVMSTDFNTPKTNVEVV